MALSDSPGTTLQDNKGLQLTCINIILFALRGLSFTNIPYQADLLNK